MAGLALASCGGHSQRNGGKSAPNVVETQWTDTAAKRTEALVNAHKLNYSLPQLRVYDRQGRLVFLLEAGRGWKPDTIGAEIDRAVASGQALRGPSLQEAVADLQTADRRPAGYAISRSGTPLVFDYWASWCVPCKILEKALLRWQSQKPAGSVQIVKAEADLMKLERARGEKVFMLRKGPDGKLHKVEMK